MPESVLQQVLEELRALRADLAQVREDSAKKATIALRLSGAIHVADEPVQNPDWMKIPIGRGNAIPMWIEDCLGAYYREDHITEAGRLTWMVWRLGAGGDPVKYARVDMIEKVLPTRILPADHVAVHRDDLQFAVTVLDQTNLGAVEHGIHIRLTALLADEKGTDQ